MRSAAVIFGFSTSREVESEGDRDADAEQYKIYRRKRRRLDAAQVEMQPIEWTCIPYHVYDLADGVWRCTECKKCVEKIVETWEQAEHVEARYAAVT